MEANRINTLSDDEIRAELQSRPELCYLIYRIIHSPEKMQDKMIRFAIEQLRIAQEGSDACAS